MLTLEINADQYKNKIIKMIPHFVSYKATEA